jgi:UDP-3-O-[3-hydroxymyristoyl] glucosamine N-acyltransferase
MADKRFFKGAGPFKLGFLADLTGSTLSDPAAFETIVDDVAPLETAHENNIGFLDNKKYLGAFKTTKASACFVRPDMVEFAPAGIVCLINKNPYRAYAVAAQAFYPAEKLMEYRASTAVIDDTAVLGLHCVIEDFVVIGKNVKIGNRCKIQSHTVIRDGVEIGDDADIGTHVYITHALIGAKVRLHSGVRIGRAGFGFALDPTGYVGVPQLGRVIIGDDVEIGENSTVDRGAGPDTVIGQGTRIDNLVQIGHNVKIGKYCVLVAQSGIAGSTEIGDYVMIGGQAGLAGHLKIGSGVKIAAQSGIMRDIPASGEYMGSPAVPLRQYMKQVALIAKLVMKKGSNDE